MAPKRKVGNAEVAVSKKTKTKQEEPKSSSDVASAKISFSIEHWWVHTENHTSVCAQAMSGIELDVAAAVKAEESSNGGKKVCSKGFFLNSLQITFQCFQGGRIVLTATEKESTSVC